MGGDRGACPVHRAARSWAVVVEWATFSELLERYGMTRGALDALVLARLGCGGCEGFWRTRANGGDLEYRVDGWVDRALADDAVERLGADGTAFVDKRAKRLGWR